MKLLKAVLYLMLSICMIWAITFTAGPKLIGWVVSRHFDDKQIRLTGLKISPKLQVSASHAVFDFSENGKSLYGVVRAPTFKIALTATGWIVQFSSGLLQINDIISLPSVKADFRTASITGISVGQLSIKTPKYSVAEIFELKDTHFSSSLDLSSMDLRNLKFSIEKASIFDSHNGNFALLDAVNGRLDKFSLGQGWQNQPLGFETKAETLLLKTDRFGEVNIRSFSLEAQNKGSVLNTILTAESLAMTKTGLYLSDIKANPSIDLMTWALQTQTRVQVEQGRFERTNPYRVMGDFENVDVIVAFNKPKRLLEGIGNFTNLEIGNGEVSLITIPDFLLDMRAMISALDDVQAANITFEAKIYGNKGGVLTGELASKFPNVKGHDCLTETCVASDISFDVKYEFEGEQVVGKGSCSSSQCHEEAFAIVVETSNTPKIASGLLKHKIINPFVLAMIVGAIMQGQEVGLGHRNEF